MAGHVAHQAVVHAEALAALLAHEAFLTGVGGAVELETRGGQEAAAALITQEGLDAAVDALVALQLAALLEGALALLADEGALPGVNLHQ